VTLTVTSVTKSGFNYRTERNTAALGPTPSVTVNRP
jgi:hypothetical protein